MLFEGFLVKLGLNVCIRFDKCPDPIIFDNSKGRQPRYFSTDWKLLDTLFCLAG